MNFLEVNEARLSSGFRPVFVSFRTLLVRPFPLHPTHPPRTGAPLLQLGVDLHRGQLQGATPMAQQVELLETEVWRHGDS